MIKLLSSQNPGYVDGENFSVLRPTDLLQVNDKIIIVDSGNNTLRILDLTLS